MKPRRCPTLIPKQKWIPDKLWNEITRTIPLACVDIVFQRPNQSVLVGWRKIYPYKNLWALPGGRILQRETLQQAAKRIANEYGLRFERLYLIGVFPIAFRKRSDVPIALAALNVSGKPVPDGYEFARFAWVKKMPKNSGANYRCMVSKWMEVRGSKDFLKLTRIL